MADIYLTTKDLEEKYRVSRATIKKWRDKGMPFYTIDGTIRFKDAEIEQWVNKQNNRDSI